jgi:hypothetical protein
MKKNTAIIILITIVTMVVISIIYNTLPRLQINGSKNMTISYRTEYEEKGVIVKNANSNYMSKIKIDNNLDTKKIGNYYIDYSLKIGGKTLHVRRNIKVIDDINPVIKLNGEQIIELSINEEYKEPGYNAYDEYDGDLTQKVETTGEVDTTKYGEYVITYKVTDNSNNKTEVNRIIKIIDEEPPIITCKTQYSAFKIEDENLIGCTAQDNYDGDITEKIQITGLYNKEQPGIYKITYKVKDDAGNETKKEHNIVIYKEKNNPVAHLIIEDNLDKDTNNKLKILKDNGTNSTFFICREKILKLKEQEKDYIEKIIEENNKIGITECAENLDNYKNFETFKKNLETIENNINKYKISKYKLPQEKIEQQTKQQIKQYLEEKKIEYYTWEYNPLETEENIIEKFIDNLQKTEKKELIITIKNDKKIQEQLLQIITLLKEMGYQID